MADNIRKTESRVIALNRVIKQIVRYRPLTGEFVAVQGDEHVPIVGPQRRTYAELMTTGLITFVESGDKEAPVRLTEVGNSVADQWGLTSQ